MRRKPAEICFWILVRIGGVVRCHHLGDINSSEVVAGSEDCLLLNVYTPLGKKTVKPHNRAVLVWIHGGGFTKGAGADYDALSNA